MDKLIELFKELKNEWKVLIGSIVITALLWYLCIFIYDRSLITEYSFYVPIIISFALSILWFPLLLFEAVSLLIIVKRTTFDKGISFLLYSGLLTSTVVLCLSIYSDLKIGKSVTLKEFIFNNFESGFIIGTMFVVIAVIVEVIRNFIDKKKEGK